MSDVTLAVPTNNNNGPPILDKVIILITYTPAFGISLLFLPLISASFKYQEEKYNKNDRNKYIIYGRTNSSGN